MRTSKQVFWGVLILLLLLGKVLPSAIAGDTAIPSYTASIENRPVVSPGTAQPSPAPSLEPMPTGSLVPESSLQPPSYESTPRSAQSASTQESVAMLSKIPVPASPAVSPSASPRARETRFSYVRNSTSVTYNNIPGQTAVGIGLQVECVNCELGRSYTFTLRDSGGQIIGQAAAGGASRMNLQFEFYGANPASVFGQSVSLVQTQTNREVASVALPPLIAAQTNINLRSGKLEMSQSEAERGFTKPGVYNIQLNYISSTGHRVNATVNVTVTQQANGVRAVNVRINQSALFQRNGNYRMLQASGSGYTTSPTGERVAFRYLLMF